MQLRHVVKLVSISISVCVQGFFPIRAGCASDLALLRSSEIALWLFPPRESDPSRGSLRPRWGGTPGRIPHQVIGHGVWHASDMILRASAQSKMFANSCFLLFAALFDSHLRLIINVLSCAIPP